MSFQQSFPIRSVILNFYVIMAFLNFLHVTHLYISIQQICCSCYSGKNSDDVNDLDYIPHLAMGYDKEKALASSLKKNYCTAQDTKHLVWARHCLNHFSLYIYFLPMHLTCPVQCLV